MTVSELEEGDGSAVALNWKATVTSAFRATLAATLKSAAANAPLNPRSSLDGGSRPSRNVAGGRSSLDGRSSNLRASLDERSLRPNGAAGSGGAGGSSSGAPAEWPPLLGQRPPARCAAVERFQQWLRLLLFQLMAALAGSGATAEGPWVAALSCLLHLCTHDGQAVRAYLEDLPLSVVAALLVQCRQHRWSQQLHAWLITLGANLLYRHSDEGAEYGMHRSVRGSVAESLRSGGGGSATGSAGAWVWFTRVGWWLGVVYVCVGLPCWRVQSGRCPEAKHPAAACSASLCPPPHAGHRSGGGSADPCWWAGSQLEPERLAAFGGMRHVSLLFSGESFGLYFRAVFCKSQARSLMQRNWLPTCAMRACFPRQFSWQWMS